MSTDSHAIPIPMSEITELFSACTDGVLLCRMINLAEPETVDERVINLAPPNRFLVTENLNLGLNAAKSIGLTVVNIGANDIIEARPHLILGLVWQLVKKALLSKINLKENPNLIRLLQVTPRRDPIPRTHRSPIPHTPHGAMAHLLHGPVTATGGGDS